MAGILWYESRRPSAKLVALVAALAALAVAARVLFAAVPNVQGTTDVALLSGYVLGPAPGFMVGALAALASNLFLGQGPWTPWQMVGWGAAGLGGALLASVAGRRLGRWPLAICCGLAGLAFGAWMDLFTLTSFAAETSTDGYIAIATLSLPFNIAHAIGNFALCLAFGPAFVRVLERFSRRLHVRWAPVDAGRARGAATITTMLALCARAGRVHGRDRGAAFRARRRALPGARAERRRRVRRRAAPGLEPADHRLGGARARGRRPPPARRAARRPHADRLHPGGRAVRWRRPASWSARSSRCAAPGVDPRRFGGRDLLADLERKRRPDGSFSGLSNWTAFGIMALRASGRSARSAAVRRAGRVARAPAERRRRLLVRDPRRRQLRGRDGRRAPGPGRRGPAPRPRGRPRAARTCASAQNPDGGFGQSEGSRSNAQSTAWAVQGLVAAGRAPASFRRDGRSPLRYLASLQQADGSFRYSRSSAQTPVWVTAQAIAALQRKAFPVGEPERRRVQRVKPAAPAAVAARTPGSEGERSAKRRAPRNRSSGPAVTPSRPQPVATRRSPPGPPPPNNRPTPTHALHPIGPRGALP